MVVINLHAQSQGKYVLLMFDEDIGNAVKVAMEHISDSDAISLVRASRIIRKEIENVKYEFSVSFVDDASSEAVPQTLQTFISMILEGPNKTNKKKTSSL